MAAIDMSTEAATVDASSSVFSEDSAEESGQQQQQQQQPVAIAVPAEVEAATREPSSQASSEYYSSEFESSEEESEEEDDTDREVLEKRVVKMPSSVAMNASTEAPSSEDVGVRKSPEIPTTEDVISSSSELEYSSELGASSELESTEGAANTVSLTPRTVSLAPSMPEKVVEKVVVKGSVPVTMEASSMDTTAEEKEVLSESSEFESSYETEISEEQAIALATTKSLTPILVNRRASMAPSAKKEEDTPSSELSSVLSDESVTSPDASVTTDEGPAISHKFQSKAEAFKVYVESEKALATRSTIKLAELEDLWMGKPTPGGFTLSDVRAWHATLMESLVGSDDSPQEKFQREAEKYRTWYESEEATADASEFKVGLLGTLWGDAGRRGVSGGHRFRDIENWHDLLTNRFALDQELKFYRKYCSKRSAKVTTSAEKLKTLETKWKQNGGKGVANGLTIEMAREWHQSVLKPISSDDDDDDDDDDDLGESLLQSDEYEYWGESEEWFEEEGWSDEGETEDTDVTRVVSSIGTATDLVGDNDQTTVNDDEETSEFGSEELSSMID